MIELRDLSKTYAKNGIKAVDRLCLNIADGEIFGFLGPNGAGKTTTIKLLSGILAPDAGSVVIDGIPLAADPVAAKRRFSYVPDTPEIFTRLTAAEYLDFIADVYEVPTEPRRERIARLAEKFRIAGDLGSRITALSHGMKQKLVLIASLLPDPANWILDEPLVGLDPEAAFLLKGLMRSRATEGKAVFFSTHVMEVAEKLCDRIGIIAGGKVVFTGTLAELRAGHDGDESLEQLFLNLTGSGVLKGGESR